MDARQLARWKEAQRRDAWDRVRTVKPSSPADILKIYSDLELRGAYTTSLDPYVPLWTLLPFFERVIVGVLPYFRDEEAFRTWYGVGIRELLDLHDRGKVAIRVLFPSVKSTVPKAMNPFMSGRFPSTVRDEFFTVTMLGEGRAQALRERYAVLTNNFDLDRAIDGYHDRARAHRTARNVYLQLHALGHSDAANQFEELWKDNHDHAFRWLELSRLLLVGPTHYSLGGIHCVSESVLSARQQLPSPVPPLRFPAELGRILVDGLRLVRFNTSDASRSVGAALELFPEFDNARQTLLSLQAAVENGSEARSLKTADDLRRLIANARAKRQRWLRTIRIAASTGVGLAMAPFDWAAGLLTGLGFQIATDARPEPIDEGLLRLGQRLNLSLPRHLTLLIGLDDAVKNSRSNPAA